MPSLAKLHNKFKGNGLIVLAIDIGEGREVVTRYARKKKLPFPVLLDTDEKVSENYRVRSHPDHFLIDRQGRLIGKSLGGRDWMSGEVQNLIHFLIKKYSI